MSNGLYIHVPFCLSKCPYCDFYSVVYNETTAAAYAAAVVRNIKHYSGDSGTFDSVYFGGGTPVLLWRELRGIMAAVTLEDNSEVTLEANPCAVNGEILTELRAAGFNRISFGVQSLDDNELRQLGRRHSSEQAIRAVELAKGCGFDNISADLMLGTPLQSERSLAATLDTLTALPLTHVSAYLLKVEPNTPFGRNGVTSADDELCERLYLQTAETLAAKGFAQYEISNFAKKGCECRHNLKYWKSVDYLGVGPAAHSCLNGRRFAVERDVNAFIGSEVQHEVETDHDGVNGFEEFAMLRLRLSEGLLRSDCERYGVDWSTIRTRSRLIPKQYFMLDDEHIAITTEGFLVSNAIIGKLIL